MRHLFDDLAYQQLSEIGEGRLAASLFLRLLHEHPSEKLGSQALAIHKAIWRSLQIEQAFEGMSNSCDTLEIG